MKREYRRSSWSSYTSTEIDVIARELLAIETKFGEVRTSHVLELARDESHALHPFIFTLSDRQAAERWRLDAVRNLCRAVEVHYIDDAGETQHTAPLMVSCRTISTDEAREESEARFTDRSYRSTERALADPVTKKEVLDEALRQADAWRVRYGHLKELSAVVAAIDAAQPRATKRRRRSA